MEVVLGHLSASKWMASRRFGLNRVMIAARILKLRPCGWTEVYFIVVCGPIQITRAVDLGVLWRETLSSFEFTQRGLGEF